MKNKAPQNLIIIKGEDKTSDVEKIKYANNYRKTIVTYRGGREYTYNSANVDAYKLQSDENVENKTVSINGEVQFNVEHIQHFGTYSRVVYSNGRYKTAHSYEIEISEGNVQEERITDVFDYLKVIADAVGLVLHGKNILADNYSKINSVLKDSVLYDYLNGETVYSLTKNREKIVFPFGFNLSQKQAVENAMNNKVSIIEGPPGTGKTQTILNIIANAIINGESVAVVSNNNTAIKNVFEKLKQNDVDFVAAVLGNRENKVEFIEKQELEIPQVANWIDFRQKKNEFEGRLSKEERALNDKLKAKNELSLLEVEHREISTEREYHKDIENCVASKNCIHFKDGVSAENILAFLAEYELINNKSIGLFRKIRWYFRYGIKDYSFVEKYKLNEIVDYCDTLFYIKRIDELNKKIGQLNNELEAYDFDSKMKEYAVLSMRLFKSVLAKKYKTSRHNKLYEANDLWRDSKSFIEDYPVVLSTTYSLRTSLNSNQIYDYVIIDEASQVDVATGALAFSCAKKAVIVGDIKQLPNVVDSETRITTEKLSKEYNVPDNYRYENNSILSSVLLTFDNVKRVLLKEHYRCVPDIINFCNKRFYDDELLVFTKENKNKKALAIYRTVPGNHARNRVNQRQIDVIKNEVLPSLKLKKGDTVGIVTPYRNQANALQKEFENTDITADTVDKFQGQERTIMIFSTVDNEIGDFAADPNRLNVAVSRATDQFIVVTDGNDNDTTSPIHDLIGYIQYNNYEVVDSEIRSIFDNLYKCYSAEREKVLKKYGRVSEYDSENLMYSLLKDTLKDDYSRYDVDMHIPLRHLIKDTSKLNERETEFVANVNSHLDFLIFSRLDYQPIMAIEVDGYKYHDANEKQLERDGVKNSIMQKYGIPLLRFSTVGSGEKRKLLYELSKLN